MEIKELSRVKLARIKIALQKQGGLENFISRLKYFLDEGWSINMAAKKCGFTEDNFAKFCKINKEVNILKQEYIDKKNKEKRFYKWRD